MKYIGLFIHIICTLALLQVSQATAAIELIDAQIPIWLNKAYDAHYNDPLSCVEKINHQIEQQKVYSERYENEPRRKKQQPKFPPPLAIHLQAFCYAQIEDYSNALNLLQPLLTTPSVSADAITTLNILALEIPEEERPHFNNQHLLKMLADAEMSLQQTPLKRSPNLAVILQMAMVHLSLQENNYHNAYLALEKMQKLLHNNKKNELHAWLAYYYGLYYDQINQLQLASSSFLLANNLANKHALLQLSGKVKKAIADIYQKKHRFQIALDFAGQRVELYLSTANKIKQADSLIQFAILKRQNNDINQSLIYLLNALDLIQSNKNSALLARLYLELGRTYLSDKNKEVQNLQLAQKYLQNARFNFTRLNKPRYQIESLLLLAKLNIMNNDSALAILQLEKILQLSQNNYLSLRVQAIEMLALSYELAGNHEQAILYFKNFHALQNRIKEHLFELQQLQISEQLQLFEKTQQQKQLQVQNTQLQQTSERYKMLAYSSASLFMLISIMFLYTLKRNQKLNDAHKNAQQRLAVHPRTKLPFQHADSNHFHYTYSGTPLYYALFNIPFLSQLNELLGTYGAMKIEKKLGKELLEQFSDHLDIFQIRGNQILFIAKQQDYKNAGDFAQQITSFFTSFSKKQQLENTVSCGIVAYPFLNNASRAFSPSRTLNLSSLALFAASQIRKQKQQSSWVELYAIDNLQPAFFNGDLWQLGQIAITKGIVKINSSHPEHHFNWPNTSSDHQ